MCYPALAGMKTAFRFLHVPCSVVAAEYSIFRFALELVPYGIPQRRDADVMQVGQVENCPKGGRSRAFFRPTGGLGSPQGAGVLCA